MRGLAFLGTVALARLLVPEDFGVFAIVSFVISLWAAFGDFGLGAALVQQPDEPTPDQLATAWTSQQLVALGAVALVWLAAPALAGVIAGLPQDAPWMLRVLSLGLLLTSLRTLPSVMMERELRFGPLATAEVLAQISYYGLALALALAGYRAWSFVIAAVGQTAVAAIVLNLAWRRRPHPGLDRHVLAPLLRFGFDYQLSGVLMSLRDMPLPAMVGWVLGPVSAGLMQFATRLALTIASIDDVVARIVFPALSRLQEKRDEQARALELATLLTALVAIPVQCSLAVLAPRLIPLVFGGQWTDAVVPLQFICIATLFRFPARYLRQGVFAKGASRRGLLIAAACLAASIVPVVPGLAWFGIPGAGAGFLVGAIAGLVAAVWLARPYVSMAWASFLELVATGLAAAGIALGGAQLAQGLDDLAVLVVAGGLFAAVFGALVWWRQRELIWTGVRLARAGLGRSPRPAV